jgi:hypothetical protein
MKTTLTAKQFIDFGKLLFSQENALKNIIDDLQELSQYVQNNGFGDDLTMLLIHGENYSPCSEAMGIYEDFLKFPLKRCPRNIVGLEKYYTVLANILCCQSLMVGIIESRDLIGDRNAKNDLKRVKGLVEKSLDIIIELKEDNGIN